MTLAVLEFDDVSYISLESQLDRLTLESNFMNNVYDTFKNIVPSLVSTLKETYSSLVSSTEETPEMKEVKMLLSGFQGKIKFANFGNHDKMLISVPEGFRGNFIEYVDTLSSMSKEVFEDTNRILGEYSFVLSAFITNKENKISLKDHTDLFSKVSKRRESLVKEIAKYYPSASNLSKAQLGKCIHRFSDVPVLVEKVDKLNTLRKQNDLREVSLSVKKCTDLLDIILDDIQKSGYHEISGSAAMNISKGAYEIARYIEFVSIYRLKVEQTVSTCYKLLDQLDKTV